MADDTPEYFRRLTEILRKAGFGWVVSQAEEHIAQGRSVAKDVQAFDAGDFFAVDTPIRGRRRRTTLVATEPYSSRERLDILLAAIESAIVQRFDLEVSVLKAIEPIQRVEFAPDTGSPEGDERTARDRHELHADRINAGGSVKASLVAAISAIRSETDVNP